MYLVSDLIDLGLPQGAQWPTPSHRLVAINLFIRNPAIKGMDMLQEGVAKVLKIPNGKIKKITFKDLPKYGFKVGIQVT
jgi:hypothetical protein